MSERLPDESNANQMLRLSRSMSTDATERHQYHNTYHQQQHPKQPYGYRGIPPTYPRQRQAPPPPPPPHPHGYPYPHSRAPPPTRDHRLQSAVTSSFSAEDEREDVAGPRGYYYPPRHATAQSHHAEDRHPEGVTRREHPDERELAARDSFSSREAPPVFDVRAPVNAKPSMPIRIPPSPGDNRQMPEDSPMGGPMGGSSSSSKVTPDGLKRSFWHHSRPTDMSGQHSMHPAFLPPKRAKVDQARKQRDIVLTPRTPGDAAGSAEYGRANSWAGPDDDQTHRHYRPTGSFPAPWQPPHQARPSSSFGGYPDEELMYSRSWSTEDGGVATRGGAFRSVQNRMPAPRPYHPVGHQGNFPPPRQWGRTESYDWSSPPSQDWHHQHRDDVDNRSLAARSYSRDMSWDDRDRQNSFDYRYYEHPTKVTPSGPMDNNPRTVMKLESISDEMMSSQSTKGPLLLLAQPEDRISLSETLCTIRENIEVFRATKEDVEAPAPGRKHPVVVGQLGLRCIHCRHTTKSSDRVKRAVCYPSSIKRIYRTVIDMKLDHFAHCRFVPTALKDRLDELKAINTRSTGTTMQYFVRAAHKMGMVDGTSGVRLVEPTPEESSISSPISTPERPSTNTSKAVASPAVAPASNSPVTMDSPVRTAPSDLSDTSPLGEKQLVRSDSNSSDASMATSDHSVAEVPAECFMGKTVLSLPEDKMALSPLRCFLRDNVFAFTATDEDIAVRTPTTFSVVVGQVGIGCVHCHALPAKERSNRAVCFPFSIHRIYQSVADIQRFHLGECKMVPQEVRDKFQELSSASSKGSKGLATRQYWVTSAKKIGLIDTTKGIRFCRDPSVPATPAVSLDILAQVASNVTTVDRPLVLPEDKPYIAEFLYRVMEQLQPCRFTEADRNKRRLKDVGCIGVECRHCAGQVESRKFFWSSVNAVESNFVSVHTHMMECKSIPDAWKEQLSELKSLRKEQTARLKTGSQKAFFQRVWNRLHGNQGGEKQDGGEEGEIESDVPQAEVVEEGAESNNDGGGDIEEKMAVISV